jgi:hypothetical protein
MKASSEKTIMHTSGKEDKILSSEGSEVSPHIL